MIGANIGHGPSRTSVLLWAAYHSPRYSKRRHARDGAIIFSDLIGKLDVLRVTCEKCGRDGCYGLNRHLEKRGRDAKLIDWLDELTAECSKKIDRK